MRPANQNIILGACRASAAEIRRAAMERGIDLDDKERRGLFALAVLIERKTHARALGRNIIDRAVTGMIELLDALDAPGEDLETWLGAPEQVARMIDQKFWAAGAVDDREEENEHGTELDNGEVDDCPRSPRNLRRPANG